MATKLYDYFLKAAEIGGIQARTRLSVISRMTSLDAKSLEDSPENLALIEKHFQTIVKEFGGQTSTPVNLTTVVDKGANIVDKIRKQMSIFADLTATRSAYSEDLTATAKRITESIVDAIDVERASIWLYNADKTAIECLDLFVRSDKKHSNGVVLNASDFPNYFKTVATQRTLAAENAHTHPGTSEFSEVYLKPLKINSMLDVPIYVNGEMAGVVCNEHTGDFRKWTTDDETFAYLMGNIVGMTIEKSKLELA